MMMATRTLSSQTHFLHRHVLGDNNHVFRGESAVDTEAVCPGGPQLIKCQLITCQFIDS